jgi:hypothetical protein
LGKKGQRKKGRRSKVFDKQNRKPSFWNEIAIVKPECRKIIIIATMPCRSGLVKQKIGHI